MALGVLLNVALNLEVFLDDDIEEVSTGGESGIDARVCDYQWILDLRDQCISKNVSFRFHQTGARLLKDGRTYRIRRYGADAEKDRQEEGLI